MSLVLSEQSDGLRVASERPDDQTTLVAVSGEVTFSNAAQLRRALDAALADSDRLVVDLTEVVFIDSSGLSTLLRASIDARERGGRMRVVRTPDQMQSVFKFKGVERLLDLVPSRELALAVVRRGDSSGTPPA
jgi:anti-sigma B factor antagonist